MGKKYIEFTYTTKSSRSLNVAGDQVGSDVPAGTDAPMNWAMLDCAKKVGMPTSQFERIIESVKVTEEDDRPSPSD